MLVVKVVPHPNSTLTLPHLPVVASYQATNTCTKHTASVFGPHRHTDLFIWNIGYNGNECYAVGVVGELFRHA